MTGVSEWHFHQYRIDMVELHLWNPPLSSKIRTANQKWGEQKRMKSLVQFIFYPVLSSSIQFYPVLSSSIQFYPVLSSSIQFYPVLSSSIQFYPVLVVIPTQQFNESFWFTEGHLLGPGLSTMLLGHLEQLALQRSAGVHNCKDGAWRSLSDPKVGWKLFVSCHERCPTSDI